MATGYDYDATLIVYKNDGTSANYEINKSGRAGQQGYGFTVYVSFYSSESYTRTGYNFIGYRLDNSSSYPMKYPGDSVPFAFGAGGGSQTQRFYCQWQLKTYTVSYNANGGSGAPSSQTKTHGVNLTLSSTVPTRTNYIFQGWATSSTGTVQYQPGGTFTTNANTVLYAIWKQAAATLDTVSNTEIGSSGAATWTIINSAHTYVLNVTFPGASTVEVTSAANTSSCSFTIPSSWLSTFSNAASGTATATLYTYNGDTLVGSTSKTFTVSVPASIVPTISAFTATPHSSNATVESWGVGTQGLSYFTLSVTATPGTSASISKISFTGHQIAQSSTSTTGDTAIVTSTGTLTYTVTVTDSRGRTATQTVNAVVYEYASPSITSLQAVRCLSDGTASDTEGNYIKALPVFVFSSVNGNNSLTVNKIEYKAHDSSTWLNGPTSLASNAWCSPFGTADITKAFDVRFTITDSLGNTFAIETIVQSVVGFALGLKNDRARFGGPVEKEGLQIDWPTEFNSTVDVTPRRCSATLSSAGWYRVMKYASLDMNGHRGVIVHFDITRAYNNNGNEVHSVDLDLVYNKIAFVGEKSVTNALLIDKVRYIKDSENGYVDIHYTGTSPNIVTVDFSVSTYPPFVGQFTAESLQSVADAPSGETILATHNFQSNNALWQSATITPTLYNLAGSITLNGNSIWYKSDKSVLQFSTIANINITSRTGGNGGFKFNLPFAYNGPTTDINVGTQSKFSNEFVYIHLTNGSSEVIVMTTETNSNITTGAVRYLISQVTLFMN